MNVVQVKLAEDKDAKCYIYQVPDNIQLLKGDVVRTKNMNGKECIAICVTDSEFLSENAINMIICGNRFESSIIGIYTLDLFSANSKE